MDLLLHRRGHAVERGRQPGELVLAVHGQPDVQPARGEPRRTAGDQAHRPHHLPGHQGGDQRQEGDEEQPGHRERALDEPERLLLRGQREQVEQVVVEPERRPQHRPDHQPGDQRAAVGHLGVRVEGTWSGGQAGGQRRGHRARVDAGRGEGVARRRGADRDDRVEVAGRPPVAELLHDVGQLGVDGLRGDDIEVVEPGLRLRRSGLCLGQRGAGLGVDQAAPDLVDEQRGEQRHHHPRHQQGRDDHPGLQRAAPAPARPAGAPGRRGRRAPRPGRGPHRAVGPAHRQGGRRRQGGPAL